VRAHGDVVPRQEFDDLELADAAFELTISAPPSCMSRTEFASAISGVG
jgi:hypothetical protein